jgi:hypothetical protein
MTLAQAQNIAKGLSNISVDTLDIIDKAGGSAAQRGDTMRASVLMSRRNYAPAADPFAAGYAALDGRKVKFQVRIEDTGQTATFTVDAGQHMRDLDDRRDVARRLSECITR